jgi:hypothetical protein
MTKKRLTSFAALIVGIVFGVGLLIQLPLVSPASAQIGMCLRGILAKSGGSYLGCSPIIDFNGTTISVSIVNGAVVVDITWAVTSQIECVMLNGAAITCDDTTGCTKPTRDNANFSETVSAFSETDQEAGFWAFETPRNQIAGGNIEVQYSWESDTLTSGTNDDLCMEVSAVSIGAGEPYESASFGTAVGKMDTGGDTDDGDRLLSDEFTVTPTGLGPEERVIVRLARDTDATPAGCDDDNISNSVDIYTLRVCYYVNNVFSGE